MQPSHAIDLQTWQARREARRAGVRALVEDGDPGVLGGWAWGTERPAVQAVVHDLEVSSATDCRRVAGWLGSACPADGPPRSEAEWDLACLELASECQPTRADGLHLLARLGDELRRRALAVEVCRPDRRDAQAQALWTTLLTGRIDATLGGALVGLHGAAVGRAFRGVSLALGLPPDVASHHAEQAVAMSDMLAWGPHLAIAARLVEAGREPVAALAAALDDDARRRVAGCVEGQASWAGAEAALGRMDLPVGADLVVAMRLRTALARGLLSWGGDQLPGWRVVEANRARIRGRLRAVARQRPACLSEALGPCEGFFLRADAAVARYAWAWAWREARTGFAFDLARADEAPCPAPSQAAQPPLQPLGPEHAEAVQAWLLLMLGRGCGADLEAWLLGQGRGLSTGFYRYLRQAPGVLADPSTGEPRSRSYERLRAHLADDGLLAYQDRLAEVARLVAALPPGRGLKARLHAVLAPAWCDDLPLPAHHISPFRDNLAGWLVS